MIDYGAESAICHYSCHFRTFRSTCLTFLTHLIPVFVHCVRSDPSCFGHYNRSCLLTYLLTLKPSFRSLATLKFIVNVWRTLYRKEQLRHRADSLRQHDFLV